MPRSERPSRPHRAAPAHHHRTHPPPPRPEERNPAPTRIPHVWLAAALAALIGSLATAAVAVAVVSRMRDRTVTIGTQRQLASPVNYVTPPGTASIDVTAIAAEVRPSIVQVNARSANG